MTDRDALAAISERLNGLPVGCSREALVACLSDVELMVARLLAKPSAGGRGEALEGLIERFERVILEWSSPGCRTRLIEVAIRSQDFVTDLRAALRQGSPALATRQEVENELVAFYNSAWSASSPALADAPQQEKP